MTLILTAATPWESKPLAAALGLALEAPGRWRGRAGAHDVLLVETGMGRARTEQSLSGLDIPAEAMLISTGLAGALQPELRCGDIVAELHDGPAENVLSARAAAHGLGLGYHVGRYACVDEVLGAAGKRALGGQKRCAAVDMESSAVRAKAAAAGAEFAILRAVLDEVDDAPPTSAPDGDGLGHLISFALRNIGRLPLLLRTGAKQKRAMTALGAFLAAYLPKVGTEAEDESLA